MDPFDVSHLSDQELKRALADAADRERAAEDFLLDTAKIEARGLELPPDVKERVQEIQTERAEDHRDSSFKLNPVEPVRLEVQIEVALDTYERLSYAQFVLGDDVLARVIKSAFQSLIEELEKAEDAARKQARG